MAGCGYVCPQCEGKGFVGPGDPCDYCNEIDKPKELSKEEDLAEWIRNVHEGPCCGDVKEE